jgi:hypothetical protein
MKKRVHWARDLSDRPFAYHARDPRLNLQHCKIRKRREVPQIMKLNTLKCPDLGTLLILLNTPVVWLQWDEESRVLWIHILENTA